MGLPLETVQHLKRVPPMFPKGALPGELGSPKCVLGKSDRSGAKRPFSEGAKSSPRWNLLCPIKSRSCCPFRFSRAGLIRGRRNRKELELDATEPATDGAGEGAGDGTQLPERTEKYSGGQAGKKPRKMGLESAPFIILRNMWVQELLGGGREQGRARPIHLCSHPSPHN